MSSPLPTTYSRLDNEGCVGCLSEGVWTATAIDKSQSAFCESDEIGYINRFCIRSKSGNGEWSPSMSDDCTTRVVDPELKNGEAYYRASIKVRK